MRKRLTLITMSMLAFLLICSTSSFAQKPSLVGGPVKSKRMSAFEQSRVNAELAKKFPALSKMQKKFVKKESLLNHTTYSIMQNTIRRGMLKAGDGTELLCNVIYDAGQPAEASYYGFYNVTATENPVFTEVALNDYLGYINGGGALIDGKFYFAYYDDSYASLGLIFSYRFVFDMETGECDYDYGELSDVAMGSAVAYDETRGLAYGLFSNEDMSSYQFASMDYTTWTKTVIGTLTNDYICMSFDGKGNLYGISYEGKVYQIDINTQAETLICETGITPAYIQACAISPKNGKMYWEWITETPTCGLMEIDLANKTSQNITTFDRTVEFSNMFIATPAAEDGAPAAPADLTAEVVAGTPNNVTVSFAMPSATYGGEAITGNLDYVVTLNGEQVATGTAEAGSTVTVNLENMPDGMADITVAAVNAVGTGATAKAKLWVGYDLPNAVAEVSLTMDGNKANVKWSLPEVLGQNGGYVDPAGISYIVKRYPEGVVVAENLTDTTFQEEITVESMALLSYGVTVVYRDSTSAEVMTNYEKIGDFILPPYTEEFATASSAELYTIIDANEDGSTWSVGEGAAVYAYSDKNIGNDWLLTPEIKLEAGKLYNFSAIYGARSAYFPERIEILMGQGDAPSAYKTVILEPTDLADNEQHETTYAISVEETGNYRVGFHAISDPDMWNLSLYAWSISAPLSYDAPNVATELAVVPAAKGELKADVVFNAPAKTIGNADLSEITKIDITTGDSLVATIANPAVGSAQTVSVELPNSGTWSFDVTAYNSEGQGLTASASAYVGIDALMPLTVLNMYDNHDGTATVEWEPASEVGVNGGYVDVSNVKYRLYKLDGGYLGDTIATVSDLSYTLDIANANEGEFNFFDIAVSALVGEEETDPLVTSIVIGAPNTLPFADSFAGANIVQDWWVSTIYGNTWKLYEDAVDNDGGCAGFQASEAGASGLFSTPKLTIKGAANPTLLFSYKAVPGQDFSLTLIADNQKKDGLKTIKEYDIKSMTGEAEWHQEVISLADFVNEDYVMIGWIAIGNEEGASVEIDNIVIKDVYGYDLASSVSAPKSTVAGDYAKFSVTVANNGENAVEAEDYTLSVTVNGVEVADTTKLQPISAYTGEVVYDFTYPVSLFDGEELAIKSNVTYTRDLEPENNAGEAHVTIKGSSLPSVADLAGTVDNGVVNLTWTAPEVGDFGETLTEDFEDKEIFEPFSVGGITATQHWGSFGNWKLYDGNGGTTYGFENGPDYPNAGAPMAYQVFNGAEGGWDMTSEETQAVIGAKSGEQFLMSMSTADETLPETYPAGDKWLISPLLFGQAQTITFWVSEITASYGNELFEVWVSSTDTEIESFTKIYEGAVTTQDWTEVSVDLPEGTTYFAIRCTSKDIFGFELDDITYTAATAAKILAPKAGGEITGYNVYRDSEKIATVGADVTTFADATATDGSHTYYVTVLYGDKESGLSNEVTVDVVTGIAELEMANQLGNSDITVYGANGAVIASGKGVYGKLAKGVYVIKNNTNGKVSVVSKK